LKNQFTLGAYATFAPNQVFKKFNFENIIKILKLREELFYIYLKVLSHRSQVVNCCFILILREVDCSLMDTAICQQLFKKGDVTRICDKKQVILILPIH